MVRQIKTKTLRERAYEGIRDSVLKNELLPGQGLSIDMLAQAMGISHTPVREAVVRLSREGLLDYAPNKKLRVTRITENDVRQVYQVRMMLEPQVAGLLPAALAADPELRKRFKRLQAKNEKWCAKGYNGRSDDFYEVDFELNAILSTAIENTLLREVFTFVGDRSLRIRTFVEATFKASPTKKVFHTIAEEHSAIIEAILAGDFGQIQATVAQHLSNSEERTLLTIAEQLNGEQL